jgi:ribosomal protein S20
MKHFETALASGDLEAADKQLVQVVKKLDQTAATSTMHKKTTARKKSRLMKQLNKAKAKQG